MIWHELPEVDDDVFTTAPHRFRFPIDVPASRSQVWESLASEESIGAWPTGPGLGLRVRWTSPRPLGVGTTRAVRLPLGVARLQEQFFRWDDEHGYSFFAEAVNRPGRRYFVEDYTIETLEDRTRLVWTVALDATSPALRRAFPLLRSGFGRMAAGARTYFTQQEQ